MRYKTRDQWGAQAPKYRNAMPRPVNLAVIHHSVTPWNADPYPTVRGIQQYHMGSRGWSDIAYQELVAMDPEHDGWVFEGRGFGYIGGATGNPPGDSHSLSICLLGNSTEKPPSAAAVESIAQRLAYAEKIGRLAPGWEIRGDRDYNSTNCPGDGLYAQLPHIRQRAAEIVAGNEPTPAPVEPDPLPPVEDDVKWLYYAGKNGTEWVLVNGRNYFPGPKALAQLRKDDVIPPAPVKLDDETSEQMWVGFGSPR